MSALRVAQVTHYLNLDTPVPAKEIAKSADKPTDLVPNQGFEALVAKDQQILSYQNFGAGGRMIHRYRSVEGHPGHVGVPISWARHQHVHGVGNCAKRLLHHRRVLQSHEISCR
jgi:hypothetical protein